MAAGNESAAERSLVVTRVLDAPREVVFQAWTDPKQMARWWGPKGFTNPVCEMDVRPGGALRIVMRAPDGAEHPMTGVFREVVEPERLVFSNAAVDKEGDPLLEGLATVAFAEDGGKTKLTLHATAVGLVPIAARMLEGMEAGWTQSLDRLAELVTNTAEREFALTRVFEAPPDLVFRAWTETERLMQWWGPKGFTMRVSKWDLRPDGVFLYGLRTPDGRDMWGKWVFREILAPERLVFVASFSDEEGNVVRAPFSPNWPLEVLSTVTFAGRGGRTTLTLRGVPLQAAESERTTFETGRESMRKGWTGTLDQLAEELAKG